MRRASRRFSVRVPVLSVQMRVVSPRFSTASRRRTRAFLAAMRWAATARERVRVGRSPSGTRATVTPRVKIKAWVQGMWAARKRRKKTAPVPKGHQGDDAHQAVEGLFQGSGLPGRPHGEAGQLCQAGFLSRAHHLCQPLAPHHQGAGQEGVAGARPFWEAFAGEGGGVYG
jgi:hypothetical protein